MKKILILLLLISPFMGCDLDKDFEEMNIDPPKGAALDVNTKMSAVLIRGAGTEYEMTLTKIIYFAQFNQFFCQNSYLQGGFYTFDATYNAGIWDGVYGDPIKQIQDIIVQLEADESTIVGSEMAIAKIWRAYLFHEIADVYGQSPYFDAGKGYTDAILKPAYDPLEDIYFDMLEELEEAGAMMTNSSTLGSADFIYQGDTDKWKKFGNSLMLRLAMRMMEVDEVSAKAWAAKAIAGGTMASNADNAYMARQDGPGDGNRNAAALHFSKYDNTKIAATFYDYLEDNNDPRLAIFTDPASPARGEFVGYSPTQLAETFDMTIDSFALANPVFYKMNTPTVLLNYSESELLKAEFAERGGTGNAATLYVSGVTASMKMWEDVDPLLAIADADVLAYLTAHPYVAGLDGQKMIGEQYWATHFFDFTEAWSNWRRTGYPILEPFGGAPANALNVTNGTIPRKMISNRGEAATNPENYAAMVSAQGNEMTTKVWWDVKVHPTN